MGNGRGSEGGRRTLSSRSSVWMEICLEPLDSFAKLCMRKRGRGKRGGEGGCLV